MLASAALPSSSLLPIPAAALPGEAAIVTKGADFGAILAQSASKGSPPMPALPEAAATAAAIAVSTEAAIDPAMTGKILPPALPSNLPPVLPDAAMTEPAEPEQTQVAPQQPASPLVPALPIRARAAAPRGETAKDKPVADDHTVQVPTEETTAPTVTLAEPALRIEIDAPQKSLPVLPPQTGPAAADHAVVQHPEPETPTLGSRAAQVILPQAAAMAAPVRKGHERTDRPETPNGKTAPLPQAPQLPAAATPTQPDRPASPPITQVRLEVAMPEAPRGPRIEAPRLLARTAEKIEAELSLLPLAPVQAAPVSTVQPAAAPMAPTTALERPQDFTALVDRLAAAREAAQPHSVSISLPHVDFGRVQLRFRHDDGALAVSMGSSDPDFARIAAQLAPPVLPMTDARSLSDNNAQPQGRQDGARPDNPGQGAATQQHANPRGQGQDRRSDAAADHRLNPHQTRAAQDERRAGRGGIFA